MKTTGPAILRISTQNAIRNFMTELNTLAHQLDPSRKTCIRRCDFCKDIVDVYSPSIWAGWYSGRYTEYREAARKGHRRTRPFLPCRIRRRQPCRTPFGGSGEVSRGRGHAAGHGEVGKATRPLAACRGVQDGDWSESYMVNLFDWHLKEQEQMPDLTGSGAMDLQGLLPPRCGRKIPSPT